MSQSACLQGRRLPDVAIEDPPERWEAWKNRGPGDYMKVVFQDGTVRWWICDPLGKVGQIGGRRVHLEQVADMLVPVLQLPPVAPWSITEHDDGTITVSPSIMDPCGWHGYLRQGVWTEAR